MRYEHRLVIATERGTGFQRNDFHIGRRSALSALYALLAAIGPDGDILEWDCGTGVGSQWMAQSGRRVLGICRTEAELRYALRRHTGPCVRFDALRAPGRSFDLVVTRAPLGTASRYARLAERVAPGGALVAPSTWPAADLPRWFTRGEPLPEILRGLPGCTQQLVLWRNQAAASS